MQDDDKTTGHIFSRREALTLIGAIGAGEILGLNRWRTASAQMAIPSCVVRPEQTQGPYFVDEKLNRADIRTDPSDNRIVPGAKLDLTFNVSRIAAGTCAPLAGVMVDVWQCDAEGIYSDARDRNFNTVGRKFLRGYQMTDSKGVAQFVTIYPGWYQGRAVHIHFKIRPAPGASRGFDFTSQLYFPDEFSDRVFASAPYNSRPDRRTRNASDGIYRQGGSQLLITPAQASSGYTARFDIGINL